ncbi:beta-1,4-galactosyltransferase galt-1-like [Haliotis rufescens]|uniref:beta-1,4-galactosyltransferase galt-1-like n=1 Tax=Haliotis rufescens TaxID=6454 RepID=UPI00201F5173|nr:beta-1,4-galactosyltransferase galt-1-like [Haliotis rufescens]
MAPVINFKRIILTGLCVYILLTVYFLLSIIPMHQNEETGQSWHHRGNEMNFVQQPVDVVVIEDNDVNSKLQRSQLPVKTTQTVKTKIPGTPKPTRLRTVKRRTRDMFQEFLKPSKVHLNFTEIAPKIFAFSAFLDDRYDTSYVRVVVIAPSGRKKRMTGFYCVFNNNDMIEMVYYETCENHLQVNAYYMLSCAVPESIARKFHDINILTISPSKTASPGRYKIINVVNNRGRFESDRRRQMGRFAVCIPPLFGSVNPLRLVEFIELSRLLGSNHFTFYTHFVSEDVMQVLKHYERQGVVTVMPWYLPVKNIWYKGQSAAVGDCLLRNMHINHLVAFNDIDEYIMPHYNNSWSSFLEYVHHQQSSKGVKTGNIAVYRFKSAFFEVPTYANARNLSKEQQGFQLTMDKFVSLRQTKRTTKLSKIRTKMMAYPTRVFELGIHHLSKQIREEYFCLDVEPEVAFLHHYRNCDRMWDMSCDEYVQDKTALRFKYSLVNNTISALKLLKHTLASI